MKLHIGNLPKSVTEAELSALLTPIATPTRIEVVKDSAGVSRGYAFAEFTTDEEARAVIAGVDGRDVGGNNVKLGETRPRKSDEKRSKSAPTA